MPWASWRPQLGGLVEFYRSPARKAVDAHRYQCAGLSEACAAVVGQRCQRGERGEMTPQAAMDSLAAQQDRILERLGQFDVLGECGPALAEERDAAYWLAQPGAPKAKLADEKPRGRTVPYEELIRVWGQG